MQVSARQQFNVTLPPGLVRRIKYRAIDDQLSASHLVEQLLSTHFDSSDRKDPPMTQLSLQPMVHVENMSVSVAFYEALGARLVHGSRDSDFVLLEIGSSQLTLLAHPPNPEQNEGTVELNFESSSNLDDVETRLRSCQVTVIQQVTDEGFGRQLQIASPDGLLIKINELNPSCTPDPATLPRARTIQRTQTPLMTSRETGCIDLHLLDLRTPERSECS